MNWYDIITIGYDDMEFRTGNEKNNRGNSILSATRPKEPILKTGNERKAPLQTRLRQKSIIKIYVDEGKYYVEHSAAYALGLITTRAVMMDKPRLVEISSEVHNRLKSDDSIEIEYINVEKKQPLKIYIDGSQYCIDNSAAYALGFLSVEQFYNSDSKYFYISEDMLNNLNRRYNVEFHSLSLEQYVSDKKL